MKRYSSFFFIAFIIICSRAQVVSGQNDPLTRSNEVSTLTPDREKFYQTLAEAWAPLFYADSKVQTVELVDDKGKKQLVLIMNPADAIVSPDFDGDEDWSNNPINLVKTTKDSQGNEKSAHSLKSQALFSVIESKTHYYIAYTKYNALDIGPGAHGQDSEVVWTVVRKENEKPIGVLEFVATNAHGFPKIYSPNANLEEKLRESQRALMNDKNKLFAEQIYLFDKQAFHHHKFGRPEFQKSETGEDRGLKVFVCHEGHALYKCNTEKWGAGYGKGYVYTCVPLGQEGEVQCYPMRPEEQRLVGYSLINQDKMLIDLYPRNEGAMSDAERAALLAKRAKFFEGQQDGNIAATVSDGKVKLRTALPIEVVRGSNDKKAEANLSNDWSLKIYRNLAIPHAVHQALDSQNKNISDEYIFNPYIEYESVKPKTEDSKKSASTGTLPQTFCRRGWTSSDLVHPFHFIAQPEVVQSLKSFGR